MDCIKFDLPIRNHGGLPHYPNPGLRATLEHYLEWLEPLVTDEELAEARAEVKAFTELNWFSNLERKMDELAEGSEDSCIYDYWVKAHLGFRDPICPYTSVPILYGNAALCGMDLGLWPEPYSHRLHPNRCTPLHPSNCHQHSLCSYFGHRGGHRYLFYQDGQTGFGLRCFKSD